MIDMSCRLWCQTYRDKVLGMHVSSTVDEACTLLHANNPSKLRDTRILTDDDEVDLPRRQRRENMLETDMFCDTCRLRKVGEGWSRFHNAEIVGNCKPYYGNLIIQQTWQSTQRQVCCDKRKHARRVGHGVLLVRPIVLLACSASMIQSGGEPRSTSSEVILLQRRLVRGFVLCDQFSTI